MQTIYCRDNKKKLRRIDFDAGIDIVGNQRQLRRWLKDSGITAVGPMFGIVRPIEQPKEITQSFIYDPILYPST